MKDAIEFAKVMSTSFIVYGCPYKSVAAWKTECVVEWDKDSTASDGEVSLCVSRRL